VTTTNEPPQRITHRDFGQTAARKHGISRDYGMTIFALLLDGIRKALSENKRVRLLRTGTFIPYPNRPMIENVNRITGERQMTRRGACVRFVPCRELKKRVESLPVD
jgi:nucleoid DNA-binding protein